MSLKFCALRADNTHEVRAFWHTSDEPSSSSRADAHHPLLREPSPAFLYSGGA